VIEVSDEAIAKILTALAANNGKVPRIIVRKGGCAGTMLALVLEPARETDERITSNGIAFAVSHEAREYVADIYIHVKYGLGSEIIIRNNAAAVTCNCGKSFRT
jgi:iron-sulfur cluster assembly accessory protein